MPSRFPSLLVVFSLLFLSGGRSLAVSGKELVAVPVSEVLRLAEGGDAYAQAFLGLSYLWGDKGLNLSRPEALKWATLAANTGHPAGLFAIGEYYDRNASVQGRYFRHLFGDKEGRLVKMALNGDPVASHGLGIILSSDLLRPLAEPDPGLAARHFSVAANAGYLPAVLHLARVKMKGIGGLDLLDVTGGLVLLERALQGGLPGAHWYAGRLRYEGEYETNGYGKDTAKTVEHFQQAAARGHGRAALQLAAFHASGRTVPLNLNLALQRAEQAVELHALGAEEILNKIRLAKASEASPLPDPSVSQPTPPLPPPPPDPSSFASPPVAPPMPRDPGPTLTPPAPPLVPPPPSALPHAAPPAVPSGLSANDAARLGKDHYSGFGVPVNFAEARKYFLVAAQGGHAEAARYLGMMYMRGKGVARDKAEAAKWLRQAVAGGDSPAGKLLELL